MVFGPTPVPTSSLKYICRVLARHGIAAFAPDLTESASANHSIARAVAAFLQNPSGEWSNAEFGFGVLAFADGLRDAAALGASDPKVAAWASVGASVDEEALGHLKQAAVPGLVIVSRGDASVDVDEIVNLKTDLPKTKLVVYPTGDSGFWDDAAPGYDDARATDTLDRLIAFFSDQLPAKVL
jgi:dienelactone hydrolase